VISVAVYFVTPTLLIGDVPSGLLFPHRVRTAEEAVRIVGVGEVAVLPANSWWMAREILRSLGLDESAIESRIRFARTGRI
jgi:hypothetical protein